MNRCAQAIVFAVLVTAVLGGSFGVQAAPIIIDHTRTNINAISEQAIVYAKSKLHIAYQHTSHGSQVTDGMSGLVSFANNHGKGLYLPANIFAWNDGGDGGALDLHDYFGSGDLGSSDWPTQTRNYLNAPANGDVNVVMWSWCGQVSGSTEASINTYLSSMSQLEAEYPDVTFVYMTGHLDGSGLTGNLHLRNEQIRDYCLANDKVLFDFADIETYNPDGVWFGDKYPTDACDYQPSGNWAVEWRAGHVEGADWYQCSAAHTDWLNGNQKAYAAWALWTSIVPEPGSAAMLIAALVGLIGYACRRRRGT